MNKTAIKKFAIESRQKLMKSVMERLEELGITEKEVIELVELGGVYTVKSQNLTEIEKKNREIIISKIQEKGYESFIEEVAYTWFNRIIAIRYMEVNDYLPFRTRVLSSDVPGKVDPDIITEIADHIEELELNRDKVIELKEHNKQEELFKYVFIKVCNYFGQLFPVMFEQIEDYTELLLPSVMISNGSVIKDMIELVPEEDWTNQVEIIGWLYQYYISEKKDQVFVDLKKNKKITKENIPAATQLFTPEWIVKYMVENSLGRLWLEGHPDEELKSRWKYYLEEVEQENEVETELKKIREKYSTLTPEDIKVLDPCMGSGHILVYAFDVFYEIYRSRGYNERDIPRLILENNLYGLDLDDRAAQLASFALIMKARQYNRRILRMGIIPKVYSIQESNFINSKLIDYIANGNTEIKSSLEVLVREFYDAKEYGSILNITTVNFKLINNRIYEIINSYQKNIFESKPEVIMLQLLLNLINAAELMTKKYDIVVTNPPYMGSSGMNSKLSNFVKKNYPTTKSDMSTVLMEKCGELTKSDGYVSMINIPVWMYLSSYESFRRSLIKNKTIINLLYFGRGVFGSDFGSTSFVLSNQYLSNYLGTYKKLFEKKVEVENIDIKERKFHLENNIYVNRQENFKKIIGIPIAYNMTYAIQQTFDKGVIIDEIAQPRQGLATGNNEKFLRLWFEINSTYFGRGFSSVQEFHQSRYLYAPYNKGGSYRKWYGNQEYVIKFDENNYKILGTVGNHLPSRQFYFNECLTWSKVTMGGFSLRYMPTGFAFDVSGCSLFSSHERLYVLLGFLNSCLSTLYFSFLSPTVNYEVGNLKAIPYIENDYRNEIETLVKYNIKLAKDDWDSFETSWDFGRYPLLKVNNSIQEAYEAWKNECHNRFEQLKRNEEELNRIFINVYGLHDELKPEIDSKDITIRKANRDRDMKSLISYAVGCMMGRYSLDEEGLIYAGGAFDESKYQTFKVDEDGIILTSDTEYFEDDLLNRFVEFVKSVYGRETLEENLNFIADTECFKRKSTESSRDCLRRYFLKGFMEDHLKVYQKRPIYWMFDSGKQNGFKALIYMHRYNEDMVAKVRTDYLHPLQRKYEAELERLDHLINFDNISVAEKGKAKKLQEKLHKQLDECTQYDLLLAHVAHQRIPLDLDDGVKVNYQKFQNIELTSDGSSKSKKGDLLYKVKM